LGGRYIQAGYGEQAGTRPGWYVLERQDGAPEQHFRAELTNVDDVVRGFVCFLEDDPFDEHRCRRETRHHRRFS
jgi:hypothetical protein